LKEPNNFGPFEEILHKNFDWNYLALGVLREIRSGARYMPMVITLPAGRRPCQDFQQTSLPNP